MKFCIGQVAATRGVADLMKGNRQFLIFVHDSFIRYQSGDWGDVCAEDRNQNDAAVKDGNRILAEYSNPIHPDWRIWIITEWDRSVTTILFPEEY